MTEMEIDSLPLSSVEERLSLDDIPLIPTIPLSPLLLPSTVQLVQLPPSLPFPSPAPSYGTFPPAPARAPSYPFPLPLPLQPQAQLSRPAPPPQCPVCNKALPGLTEQQISSHVDDCLTLGMLKEEKEKEREANVSGELAGGVHHVPASDAGGIVVAEPRFVCPYQVSCGSMTAVEFAGHVARMHRAGPHNVFCPICDLLGERTDVDPRKLNLWAHLHNDHTDLMRVGIRTSNSGGGNGGNGGGNRTRVLARGPASYTRGRGRYSDDEDDEEFSDVDEDSEDEDDYWTNSNAYLANNPFINTSSGNRNPFSNNNLNNPHVIPLPPATSTQTVRSSFSTPLPLNPNPFTSQPVASSNSSSFFSSPNNPFSNNPNNNSSNNNLSNNPFTSNSFNIAPGLFPVTAAPFPTTPTNFSNANQNQFPVPQSFPIKQTPPTTPSTPTATITSSPAVPKPLSFDLKPFPISSSPFPVSPSVFPPAPQNPFAPSMKPLPYPSFPATSSSTTATSPSSSLPAPLPTFNFPPIRASPAPIAPIQSLPVRNSPRATPVTASNNNPIMFSNFRTFTHPPNRTPVRHGQRHQVSPGVRAPQRCSASYDGSKSPVPLTSAGYRVSTLQAPLPEKECFICFEEFFIGQDIARVECMCVFHQKCLEKWYEVRRCCPFHVPPPA